MAILQASASAREAPRIPMDPFVLRIGEALDLASRRPAPPVTAEQERIRTWADTASFRFGISGYWNPGNRELPPENAELVCARCTRSIPRQDWLRDAW